MLTIYVSAESFQRYSADGIPMTVRMLLVENEGRHSLLEEWVPSDTFAGAEFALERGLGRFVQLPLPLEVTKATNEFLSTHHAQTNMDFDCYAFANSIKGVTQHKARELRRHWNIKFPTRRVRVGDIIFLCRSEVHFCHAAVYIGFGLYLSVWGAGGQLEVTTLRSMQKNFRADFVFGATPK